MERAERDALTRHVMWSKNRKVALSVLFGFILTTPATAKDLGVLTRMLYAADLADQANGVCDLVNPHFSIGTWGSLGGIHFYAQHIKSEVIFGLNQSEAVTVLKSAADAALADMLLVRHKIKTAAPDKETGRVMEWCDEIAKPLIQAVISTHDEHHREIDDLLAKAKTQ